MFTRFSANARQVIVHAQAEARELGHDHVGTEHLLLGLMHPAGCFAACTLHRFGLTQTSLRAAIRHHDPGSPEPTDGPMPLTDSAHEALELALGEMALRGGKTGTPEHLLLGVLALPDSLANRVLREKGADLDGLRAAVLEDQTRWDHELSFVGPAAGDAADVPSLLPPAADMEPLLHSAMSKAWQEGRATYGLRDLLSAIRDNPSARLILEEELNTVCRTGGTPASPVGAIVLRASGRWRARRVCSAPPDEAPYRAFGQPGEAMR